MNTVETVVTAVAVVICFALVCTTVGTVETARIRAKYLAERRREREQDGRE